jgi:adenylate kinase family enzyme
MCVVAEEEEVDGLRAEVIEKIGAIRDAEVERITAKWDEEEHGDVEMPEIDRDGLEIRVPDDIIFKLKILRINENDCRNRGYILDGYPRNYKEAQNIFLIREKKFDPETGDEIEEDEPELEEGEEKSFDGFIIDKSTYPSSGILL